MDATSSSGKAEASQSDDKLPPDLPNVESPALAPGQSESAKNTAEPGAVDGHKVSTAVAIYKGSRANAAPDLDPAPSILNRLWSKTQIPPLAAAIVLMLGVGALAGSLGIIGMGQLFDAPKAAAQAREAALKETIAQLSTDVDALKAAQAVAAKAASSQLTRLTERLDKAERTQAEPAAKVARLTETVNQLERRVTTAASNQDITGSVPMPRAAPTKDTARLPVIQGWVLQRVVDGTAIISSREGMIEVGVGDGLPGGGRVEDILRRDGRWIVVTSRGLVTMR